MLHGTDIGLIYHSVKLLMFIKPICTAIYKLDLQSHEQAFSVYSAYWIDPPVIILFFHTAKLYSDLKTSMSLEHWYSLITGSLMVKWFDPSRWGDLNQAMMELGATLCSDTKPSRFQCPLSLVAAKRSHFPAKVLQSKLHTTHEWFWKPNHGVILLLSVLFKLHKAWIKLRLMQRATALISFYLSRG